MQPEQNTNQLPGTRPDNTTSDVSGIDTVNSDIDNVFLVQPPEKQPLDKKGITIVVIATIVGVIVLIAVLVFALIGSADGLARDYRQLSAKQLTKLQAPLKDIDPEAALNRRNLEGALSKISLSEQSQPSLESVLFVGEWSAYYKSTEQLQKSVVKYYKDLNTYNRSLQSTLLFDAALQEIAEKELVVLATINPDDALTIRSVGGSYRTFSEDIAELQVGSELDRIKEELVDLYEMQSTMYLGYAKAVESKDVSAIEKATAEITQVEAKITIATEDQVYIDALLPTYAKVNTTQKQLLKRLSS